MPRFSKPVHKISIWEIRRSLTKDAKSTQFSYNDLLAEWDRRRAAWRDRFLVLAGVLASMAAVASFAKDMGWLTPLITVDACSDDGLNESGIENAETVEPSQ